MIAKRYWIMAGLAILSSFIVELLSSYVSFLTLELAFWLFWIGLSVTSLFAFIEIFALVHDFMTERFFNPRNKLKIYKERIQSERKKIQKLLNFDVESSTLEELKNHIYEIEDEEFSKEALAPYLTEWYNHTNHVYSVIQDEERRSYYHDFEHKKEVLEKELNAIKAEKERLLQSEEEHQQTKKEQFLEEHKDSIHVDATNLTEEQKRWLEQQGYKRTHQWCIQQKQSVEFMIKPRHNEGLSHAYLTGAIYKYIKEEGYDPDVQLPTTKTADIIFTCADIKFAIEIETGKVHQKNKKQLLEKISILDKKYPKAWFFVVTNKNLLSKYRKLGEAVDRRNVIEKIDSIFYPEGLPTP